MMMMIRCHDSHDFCFVLFCFENIFFIRNSSLMRRIDLFLLTHYSDSILQLLAIQFTLRICIVFSIRISVLYFYGHHFVVCNNKITTTTTEENIKTTHIHTEREREKKTIFVTENRIKEWQERSRKKNSVNHKIPIITLLLRCSVYFGLFQFFSPHYNNTCMWQRNNYNFLWNIGLMLKMKQES